MNQVCHLFTKIKMLSLFSEKLPLKNLAYTHRKKVGKNACTLFYFKIKKKKQHFTSSLLHVFEMSKKKRKEKCFIILNSLWEKNESK